jgi:hypothetical protein
MYLLQLHDASSSGGVEAQRLTTYIGRIQGQLDGSSRMDVYTYSYFLQSNVYRVDYPGSQTLCYENGFFAKDAQSYICDDQQFIDSLIAHRDWYSSTASPFISVFSDLPNAENWALAWERNNGQQCHVVEIRADVLVQFNSKIFSVAEIQQMIPWIEAGPVNSEYLILHHIPREAIGKGRSTEDIRFGTSLAAQNMDFISTNRNIGRNPF